LELVPIIHTDSAVDRRYGSDQLVDKAIDVDERRSDPKMLVVPQWIPERREIGVALVWLNRSATALTLKFIMAKLGRRLINSYYVVL